MERLSSRKFMSLVGVFLGSFAIAWFKPEFVGNAGTLFNFWTMLLGIYFGANVTEKFVTRNGSNQSK